MNKIAIMQPYFLPYIGYWQLIASVDEFVVYDNIQFTKKGWFNRNRILDNGTDRLFTIPIKKDSDYLNVAERLVANDAAKENEHTMRIIQMTYKKAPYYPNVYPLIERCFMYEVPNLFEYIYHSIREVCAYLEIDTKITVSSSVPIDHTLKAEKKVIALCKALGAERYINAAGGMELYDKKEFSDSGIDLVFIKPQLSEYMQYGQPFVSGLSIIDVLMFNDKPSIKRMLTEYELT